MTYKNHTIFGGFKNGKNKSSVFGAHIKSYSGYACFVCKKIKFMSLTRQK